MLLAWTLMVGALALTVTGCNRDATATQESLGKPVRVEKVGRGDIADVLVYPATLRAYSEVRIFSTIPDLILEFPWNDGDEIQRGERVALIKRGAMDQGLANMSAQVEGLDAQIANTESELERTRGLLAAGAVAQAAYDRLDTQLKSLQAQRKAMLAARGQLAVQAGNAYITAPISGVIAGKALERGDMAVPQVPLCRILGVDRLKLDIRLVESDVRRVKLDQEVKLHLDAYPNRTFDGKVTSILPYMDPATRTNTVEVTLDNPKDEAGLRLLKPGMFGRAEFIVAVHEKVLLAPEPSLLLDNDVLAKQQPGELLRKAFVVDDQNIARERLVRCGARKGSTYEVLEGLKEGDRIITRGQHGLQDGQRVEVMEASSE
jgi:RND family efflux transporter MFP subunit